MDKLIAVSQWVALLAIPQLVWRPHWDSYLAFIGGERAANVWGNFLLSALLLLCGNLFFAAVYALRWDCFERHKVQRDKPWPWHSPAPGVAAKFAADVRTGALLAALNLVLTVPLGAASYANVKALGYSASARDFPSALTMAWQLAVFALVEDALFYWGHRALHSVLYAHVHKVHHAFTTTVCIAATATHPVEYVLSNVLPFVAGPTLLGAHAATLYVWLIYRMGETMAHHSGYDFPWSMFSLLPGQGSAVEHDLHHSKQVGNYGSMFVFWDWACGTRVEAGGEGKEE